MRRCLLLLVAAIPLVATAHEYPDTVRVKIGNMTTFKVIDHSGCSATVWIDQIFDPSLATITPQQAEGAEVTFTVQANQTAGVTTVRIHWIGEDVGKEEGFCFEDTREDGGRTFVLRVTPDEVNSALDQADWIPGDGMCDTGKNVVRGSREEPQCTLRAAIQEANAGGDASITFDITDQVSAPYVVQLDRQLPALMRPMSISGPAGAGKALAAPGIVITGGGAGFDGIVVTASAAGSRLDGLSIVGMGNGVVIQGESVVVVRCYVGLSPLGGDGNLASGIRIEGGTSTQVGGSSAADRNVIGSNADYGIDVIGASGVQIRGNWIGLRPDGSSAAGNGKGGIRIGDGTSSVIGGPTPSPGDAPGNRIAASGPEGGIILNGDLHTVKGNLIGSTDGMTAGAANEGPGIVVEGASITIGGAEEDDGNVIAHNDSSGVVVLGETTERVTIRRNLMYENGGLSIDLGGDGPTANDPGTGTGDADDDEGVNHLQNYPVALLVSPDPFDASKRIISGVIDATNPRDLIIELYSSEMEAATRAGETRFGALQVYVDTTRTTALGVIHKRIDPAKLPHRYLSATATDTQGNTSEVSWICIDTDGDDEVDADNDGACDDWETGGIDYDGDGTRDLDLAAFGPKLTEQDIFVEVDWMTGHEPIAAGLADVKNAFAAAPTPAGFHAFKDEEVPLIDPIRFGNPALPGGDDNLREIRYGNPENPCGDGPGDGHFGPKADRMAENCGARLGARRLVFRYNVFGPQYAETPGSSGRAQFSANNFIVTIGSWSDNSIRATSGLGAGAALADARQIVESSTLMHELGHTLGIHHGGWDDENCKPNHASIMSYALQFPSSIPNRVMDYSREKLLTLDENALDETAGLRGRENRLVLFRSGERLYFVPTTQRSVDWSDDGNFDVSVAVDVNNIRADCFGAGLDNELKGHDDWDVLDVNFRVFNRFADGSDSGRYPDEDMVTERTEADVLEDARTTDFDGDGFSNADDNCPAISNPGQEDTDGDGIGDTCEGAFADVALRLDGSDPSALTVLFTITATNHGPNPAVDLVISDTLGFWFSPGTASASSAVCSVEGQLVRCDVPSLAVGDSVVVTFDATTTTAGLTGNMAHVSSAYDPNPYNNQGDFVGVTAVNVDEPAPTLEQPPNVFRLHAPWPNPFLRRARIRFDLATTDRVSLAVYDIAGRQVALLADGVMEPGTHEVVFDGDRHPAGVYVLRLQAGGQTAVTNLVLLR